MFHEIDPHLPCVVINETHVVFASSNGLCLCPPHIWVDHFQRFGNYMSCLNWEWMPSLLPQLACFTNFWHHLFFSKFGKTSNKIMFLHQLKMLEINMANPLVPNCNVSSSFSCANNMEFTSSMFTSKVNIHPFLFPFAINLLWFFMSSTKYPLKLNVTSKPCSTIWPTRLNSLLWLEHRVHLAWTMEPYQFCDGMCSVITSFHKPSQYTNACKLGAN